MTPDTNGSVFRTPEGGWRIGGTRVSLDSVVHAYRDGRTAEAIVADLPSLTLEQVHGAIAFYVQNRVEIDSYLAAQQERWERLRREEEARDDPLLERLRAMKREQQAAAAGTDRRST